MEVKIKNLGKLTDATIHIGQFTVFAGLNSTGKSFASKALYSLFSAMNANHLEACFRPPMARVKNEFVRLERHGFADPLLDNFLSRMASLDSIITNMSITEEQDEFLAVEALLPSISDALNGLEETYNELEPLIKEFISALLEREGQGILPILREEDVFRERINRLVSLRYQSSVAIVEKGARNEISRNFRTTFQVPKIADLKKDKNEKIEFNVEGVGSVTINSGINFKMGSGGLTSLQKYSGVIYLESPVYSVLKSVLDHSGKGPFRLRQDSLYLNGIPKYFRDLSALMPTRYAGDLLFPDIVANLENTLNGKVYLSSTGELFYQEKDGGSYPLNLTAMGIANLGVLAMLIERNLFDDGTFLFIDEPEAHLHPDWQMAMMDTLLALSRKGVHVVMATHSSDILKYLEVELKKSEDFKDLLQLNHFTPEGVNLTQYDNVSEKLHAIKKELTDSYYELHIKGLL